MDPISIVESHHRPAYKIFLQSKNHVMTGQVDILLHIMTWLPWCDYFVELSTGYKYIQCLRYAREHVPHMIPTNNACDIAAFSGSLECLKYLVDWGGYITEETKENSIMGGSLDCYLYLNTVHNNSNDKMNIYWTSYIGNLNFFKHLVENENHKILIEHAMNFAILGHLEGAQYVCNLVNWKKERLNDFEIRYSMGRIAESGTLECFHYMHMRGCCFDYMAIKSAIYSGNLDILKYICDNGGMLEKIHKSYAYKNNECLMYVKQQLKTKSIWELE